LNVHIPAGLGISVGVGVTVGVDVSVGVNVTVGVSVRVGVRVIVDVRGISVTAEGEAERSAADAETGGRVGRLKPVNSRFSQPANSAGSISAIYCRIPVEKGLSGTVPRRLVAIKIGVKKNMISLCERGRFFRAAWTTMESLTA